ncbi:MAG: ABC transporter ATP-binding protein [Bacteroidales bacterium]|jgi:ABC-2 type transport system ATP-binding protein|nr:ABC transporter ATP-binding protein [Bacteroidales bacterium]MDD3989503.1 ABC transporter ATP-binding protein [Bacteroidales bacterium]
MTAEILVHELFKKYPNGIEALKGISLEIQKGQFFTLLGPNGAGKSTLVKVMTTLINKDSGDFCIAGINPEINQSKIQKIIGVASQDNEIDPTEKVENLLIFQGRLFGLTKPAAVKRTNELIQLFELEKERNKKAGVLSGGNKRRLHCALALVHRPQILFLDEPTVGMDPVARANFWEVITQLNCKEKVTVFLTTQYLDEADKHAFEMALIVDGKIQYSGTIANFKKMVNPIGELSLDDSYLQFVKALSDQELTNN